MDLYPTILEMVGIELPSEQVFDGVSIVPALRGEGLEREAIFTYFPSESPAVPDRTAPGVSVRWGDMKLIRYFHANPALSHAYDLYDLQNDPGEKIDLADAMPNVVAMLDAKIEAFLAETDAVVPVPNQSYVAGSRPARSQR
jgi:arylsulfatase A-like enzyme